MKCPCCGKALTVGQELLYKLEDVYYCPCCLVKITGWRDGKSGTAKLGKVEPQEERLEKARAKSA